VFINLIEEQKMNTDKLIPTSYVRKFTPLVRGDRVYKKNNTVYKVENELIWNNDYDNEGWYLVSFADRPNTGVKAAVCDAVVVDVITGVNNPKPAPVSDFQYWWTDGTIKSWKPNHAAMLKQYQAEPTNDQHHIEIQIEALGEPVEPVEFVEAERSQGGPVAMPTFEFSEPTMTEVIMPDGEKRTVGVVSCYEKPTFTQAKLEVYHGDEWHECIRFGLDIFGNHAYQISSGEFRGEFNATSKPSDFRKDSRTDEEKLLDAVALTTGLRPQNGLHQVVNNLLSSDKFTITLN
jgi:hypothetical protein